MAAGFRSTVTFGIPTPSSVTTRPVISPVCAFAIRGMNSEKTERQRDRGTERKFVSPYLCPSASSPLRLSLSVYFSSVPLLSAQVNHERDRLLIAAAENDPLLGR